MILRIILEILPNMEKEYNDSKSCIEMKYNHIEPHLVMKYLYSSYNIMQVFLSVST